MRARLQRFLPVVLLALVMQVLAPIAACWAAGQAIADPLQSAAICHGASEQGGPSDQTGTPAAHAGACALCCLAQANASFDSPPQAATFVPFRRARPQPSFPSATPNAWSGTRRMRPLSPPIRSQAPRRGDLPTFPDGP